MVGPAIAAGGSDDLGGQSFHSVSDDPDVGLWEGAPTEPLVKYSGARTVIDHPSPTVSTDSGELPLNREKIGIWGPDREIQLKFDHGTADFEGKDWDLVVARTDPGALDGSGGSNTGGATGAGVLGLLDGDADAHVEIAETRTYDEGTETYTYDPSEPGAYTFFVVNSGSVSVDGEGNVTDVSDAKVVGFDSTLVQDERAEIESGTKEKYEPGESISLEVDSKLSGDSGYTHAVLLFQEDALLYENSKGGSAETVTFRFDGTLGQLPDARAADFTAEIPYRAVDGVVEADGDVDAFGMNFEGRNRTGKYEFETLSETLLGGAGLGEMDVRTTDDKVLNASLTVVDREEPSTTVEVGTTENFSEGWYDVVYVAEGNDDGELSTVREKVHVKTETDPGPSPPISPPRGPPSAPPRGPPADPPRGPPSEAPPGPKVDVRPNGNAASIAFERVAANTRNAVEFPEAIGTERASVASIAINTTSAHESVDMSVDASESVPGGTPDLDAGEAISYLDVTVTADGSVEYNEAEFTFSVDEETLEERGISQDRVRLFRYNEDDQEWQQLPTEHRGGDTYVATSPGFSVFAVGAAEQQQQQQPESGFEVSDAAVDGTDVEVGETVAVTATVENTGDQRETFTVDLTVDGDVVDSTDVTLDAGERTEVDFEQTFEEAGSYEVAVAGEVAGTVEVSESAGSSEPVEEGVISPGVVLLVVLGLLVLGGGAAYYARNSEAYDFGA